MSKRHRNRTSKHQREKEVLVAARTKGLVAVAEKEIPEVSISQEFLKEGQINEIEPIDKEKVSPTLKKEIDGPKNAMEEEYVRLIGIGDHADTLSRKLVDKDASRFADLTMLGIRRWTNKEK